MVSIEFKQLRYALAVLDHGSFARAAPQLGLETSALCRRITDLEVRLGVQLFERSARGAAPTPAGLAYLKEAREVLMRLDRAGDHARRSSRNAPPELTVGFIWSFARGQAARVIAAFGKEAPDVVIYLVEDGPMGLAQRLTRGEIDICITATPDPSDIVAERIGTLQQRRLWTEDLYAVAPRGTPLESCSWDDLVDRTLLTCH